MITSVPYKGKDQTDPLVVGDEMRGAGWGAGGLLNSVLWGPLLSFIELCQIGYNLICSDKTPPLYLRNPTSLFKTSRHNVITLQQTYLSKRVDVQEKIPFNCITWLYRLDLFTIVQRVFNLNSYLLTSFFINKYIVYLKNRYRSVIMSKD